MERVKKCCFIGHRQVLAENINEKLSAAISKEISNGCNTFIMGTHGEFDRLSLNACRNLRNIYKDIRIEVAITSVNAINRLSYYNPYPDVETVMYQIEEAHFKRQITLSNRLMIDNCDVLICYVNTAEYQSGAKTAMRYAEKQGLKIINLYCEEDQPFYGMSKEEKAEYFKKFLESTKPIK